MTKKADTIKLQGKEYAQVKDRIKEFREDNPNGLIETTPTVTGDSIIFKARIVKDKGNPASAEATGHSFAKVTEKTVEKQFEKQESIAVGRALALLGYLASGEIASSDEMEEFLADKQEKLQEAIFECMESIGNCATLDELKTYWSSLSGEMRNVPELLTTKDAKKAELTKSKDIQ